MRILLDECPTGRLRHDLPAHEVQTVQQAGWAGVQNGRLLHQIAESGRFDVFVTMDKSLPHQQNLHVLPFAVVILRAPSNRFEDTHPLMPELLRRLHEARPGQALVVKG